MNDYPNDGQAVGTYNPEPDKQQAQKARKETSTIGQSLPVIPLMMEWFDKVIAGCDSVAQVKDTAKRVGCTIEEALEAHDIVRQLLTTQRDELQAHINAYKQEQKEKRDGGA